MLDTVVIGWCWLSMVQVSMCLFGHQYSNKKEKRSGWIHAWHSCHSFVLTVGGAGVDVSIRGGPQQAQPQHRPLRPALRYGGQPSQNCWVSSMQSFSLCLCIIVSHCVYTCDHIHKVSKAALMGIWSDSFLCLSLIYISLVVYEEKIIYCVLLLFFLLFFLLIFLFVYLWKNGTEW